MRERKQEQAHDVTPGHYAEKCAVHSGEVELQHGAYTLCSERNAGTKDGVDAVHRSLGRNCVAREVPAGLRTMSPAMAAAEVGRFLSRLHHLPARLTLLVSALARCGRALNEPLSSGVRSFRGGSERAEVIAAPGVNTVCDGCTSTKWTLAVLRWRKSLQLDNRTGGAL